VKSVDVEFNLPADKVEELRQQLEAAGHGYLERVTHDFPPVMTGEFQDLSDFDRRGPDRFAPFNATAHMKKLDIMQQYLAAFAYQKEQLSQMNNRLAKDPPNDLMLKSPSRNIGPVPMPNATTLPFPYAGLEGVLTPRYKPPPAVAKSKAMLFDLEDDWEDVRDKGRRTIPVAPVYIFAKDGCDMNLQCLTTDIYRMEAGVKELGRVADTRKLENEMQLLMEQRRVPRAVTRRLFDIELTVQEKDRLLEELEWNKRLEVEQQFWVERSNLHRYYHELYTGKLETEENRKKAKSLHPKKIITEKNLAREAYLHDGFFEDLRRGRANFDVEITELIVGMAPATEYNNSVPQDLKTYGHILGRYEWMGSYGTERIGQVFLKNKADERGQKPRIQYDRSSHRWVFRKPEGSLICQSEASDKEVPTPTVATWIRPPLLVSYVADVLGQARQADDEDKITSIQRASVSFAGETQRPSTRSTNIPIKPDGSAFATALPPSRGRQKNNAAAYMARLRALQQTEAEREKGVYDQLTAEERAERVIREWEQEAKEEAFLAPGKRMAKGRLSDASGGAIGDKAASSHEFGEQEHMSASLAPERLNAMQAVDVDQEPPPKEEAAGLFSQLVGLFPFMRSKLEINKEQIPALLLEDNVIVDYVQEVKLPEVRARYDGACLWEELKLTSLMDEDYDPAVWREKVVEIHHKGHIGAGGGAQAAQVIFTFLWAASRHPIAGPEGLRVIGLCQDIITKYPYKAWALYYWAIETTIQTFIKQPTKYQDQVRGPLFDTYAFICRLTYGAACYSTHSRLISGLALTCERSARVTAAPIAFVLNQYDQRRSKASGPLHTTTAEYMLQVLAVTQKPILLGMQMELVVEVLHAFKFDTRIAVRGCLCVASLCELGKCDEYEDEIFRGAEYHPKSEHVDFLVSFSPYHIRNVIDVMDLYSTQRKVQGAGCQALVSIASVNSDQALETLEYGGLRAILSANKVHPKSSTVALALMQIYVLAARSLATNYLTRHMFQMCTTVMEAHGKEVEIARSGFYALVLSVEFVKKSIIDELRVAKPWDEQWLCKFALIAERFLCDERITKYATELLLNLAASEIKLLSTGGNAIVGYGLKVMEQREESIPAALEVVNRIMKNTANFNIDTVRKLDTVRRIIRIFQSLGPMKLLNAEQTRWLLLTLGNLAFLDPDSIKSLWTVIKPRIVWKHIKFAAERVSVEDDDIVAQATRTIAWMLNVEDPKNIEDALGD